VAPVVWFWFGGQNRIGADPRCDSISTVLGCDCLVVLGELWARDILWRGGVAWLFMQCRFSAQGGTLNRAWADSHQGVTLSVAPVQYPLKTRAGPILIYQTARALCPP